MWQLKSLTTNPPGNFAYEQYDGIRQSFKAQPVIEEVAKAVSSFRIANRLPRGSLGESLEDIDRQTCARIGNNSGYCWDCPSPYPEVHATHRFFAPPCGTCGTPVQPT